MAKRPQYLSTSKEGKKGKKIMRLETSLIILKLL